MAVPFDAFIPPFNDEDFSPVGSMFEGEFRDFDNRGVLFVGEMSAGARMDFVISHLRKDMPVDVVLVYSTGIAYEGEELPPGLEEDLHQGEMGPEMGPREPEIGPPEMGSGGPEIGPPEMGSGGPGIEPPEMGPRMPRQANREELEKELHRLHEKLRELETSGAPEKEIKGVIKEIERLERKLMKHEKGHKPGWKPKPKDAAVSAKQALGVELLGAGKICLDLQPEHWEILAGVRVHPVQQFLEAPTKLGKALPNPRSVTVSVDLSDLVHFEGHEIFIQALAFPVPDPGMPPLSNLDFAQAQASECDRFLVHHPSPPDEMGEMGEDESYTGTKGGDDGDDDKPNGGEGMPEDECSGKMC